MSKDTPPPSNSETDPRFPSGPWVGFFLQKAIPGKHQMELRLNFAQGAITGEGRDWVGMFILRGKYDLGNGSCYWNKQYVGKHSVFYRGYNEGKGIYGVWEIPTENNPDYQHGGFCIWPEGQPDPTEPHLKEEIEEPIVVEEPVEVEEAVAVPGHGKWSS
jgi:hypothetical protein